jgi:hypothetical protein
MIITKTDGGTLFIQTGHPLLRVPFGYISGIVIKNVFGNIKFQVSVTQDGTHSLPDKINFRYADVTLPLSLSPSDLRTKILALNVDYVQPEYFFAIAGQTEFTVARPMSINTMVFADNQPKVLNQDFTINLVTNKVTFTVPMLGGEAIIIQNFR